MGWEKVEKDVTAGPFGLFKWAAILVISLVVLFGSINLILKPASVAVDRVVMKNSFQYKEGMEQRAAILQANLDELNIKLSQNPANKNELEGQRMIIRSQLKAITINN